MNKYTARVASFPIPTHLSITYSTYCKQQEAEQDLGTRSGQRKNWTLDTTTYTSYVLRTDTRVRQCPGGHGMVCLRYCMLSTPCAECMHNTCGPLSLCDGISKVCADGIQRLKSPSSLQVLIANQLS